MKLNLYIVIIFLFTLTLGQQINAADSYLMFCRTGGNMKIKIVNQLQIKSNLLQIYFDKSRFKYDPKKPELKPGECAWLNRPINNKEPRVMNFSSQINITYESNTSSGSKPTFDTSSSGGVHNSSRGNQVRLKKLLNSLHGDNYFAVKVINEGRVFEITSFE